MTTDTLNKFRILSVAESGGNVDSMCALSIQHITTNQQDT
jgi:hypothetical protein